MFMCDISIFIYISYSNFAETLHLTQTNDFRIPLSLKIGKVITKRMLQLMFSRKRPPCTLLHTESRIMYFPKFSCQLWISGDLGFRTNKKRCDSQRRRVPRQIRFVRSALASTSHAHWLWSWVLCVALGWRCVVALGCVSGWIAGLLTVSLAA